jgi:hypothetical protein
VCSSDLAAVRFSLTNPAGLVDWEVCSTQNTPCPAANIIQSHLGIEGTPNARVSVDDDGNGDDTNYGTLTAGEGFPAHTNFNGLGRIARPGGAAETEVVRIDVYNAIDKDARRLIILIGSPGGLIRMCDPLLAKPDAQAC